MTPATSLRIWRDDVLEEAEHIAAVRQQRDREAGLGDDAQEGGLADRAAVVAEHDGRIGRDDLPAEAPGRAHAGQTRERHLRGAHGAGGQRRQDPRAVGTRAFGEVHGDEAEEVARAHREHRARGLVRACQRPGRRGDLDAVLAGSDVADGGAEEDRLVGAGCDVGEAERGHDVVDERLLPRLAAQHLDESAEQAEAHVVVGEELAGREELREARDDVDVLLDRVVAAAGVGEDVALESRLVAQQLTRGDRRGGRLVLELELGQVAADRGVEVEHALVDELHDERRGPDLRDRADLEHRVGASTSTPVDVLRTPAPASMICAVLEDGDGRTGNLVLGDELGEAGGDELSDVVE